MVGRVTLSAPTSMPAYYDATVSGDGNAALAGGTNVIYFVFRTTVQGNIPRILDITAPDHLLRLGWISFGRDVTLPGDVARTYWMEPIFLNFLLTRWQPSPNNSSTSVLYLLADRVRWHLADGAEGRLYVFGV